MSRVSHEVEVILQYTAQSTDHPQDPFEGAYEALTQSMAANIVLYSVLRHLEDRLNDVS